LYYYKPYTRIQGYLIGLLLGCKYFTYKYETAHDEKMEESDDNLSEDQPKEAKPFVIDLMDKMREDKKVFIGC